jgi:prevent-host-death family protein
MYNTEGVDAIATITELRSETSELIEHVRNTKSGVLIQKNNEPHAVLIDWETYKKIKKRVDLSELQEQADQPASG